MKNKAIKDLTFATDDSLKGFKKLLGSTALATTLVATSLFTGLTPANANWVLGTTTVAAGNNHSVIVSANDAVA